MFVTNSFSLSMVEDHALISVQPIDSYQVMKLLPLESAIGHADTAAIVSRILATKLDPNRISIKLKPKDSIIVAQYKGPRLPEGTTELPPGSEIQFLRVDILL